LGLCEFAKIGAGLGCENRRNKLCGNVLGILSRQQPCEGGVSAAGCVLRFLRTSFSGSGILPCFSIMRQDAAATILVNGAG
jgi:hypothetical protein